MYYCALSKHSILYNSNAVFIELLMLTCSFQQGYSTVHLEMLVGREWKIARCGLLPCRLPLYRFVRAFASARAVELSWVAKDCIRSIPMCKYSTLAVKLFPISIKAPCLQGRKGTLTEQDCARNSPMPLCACCKPAQEPPCDRDSQPRELAPRQCSDPHLCPDHN